jgi:hypothetical protein
MQCFCLINTLRDTYLKGLFLLLHAARDCLAFGHELRQLGMERDHDGLPGEFSAGKFYEYELLWRDLPTRCTSLALHSLFGHVSFDDALLQALHVLDHLFMLVGHAFGLCLGLHGHLG